MKRVVVVAFVLAVLGWTVPARAVIGTLDQVPGATLLLPYFEVDLADPNGVTTLLSINNASAAAVLTHVVFYSDLSVPTLTFNVYLTGFDVQTINLRDIFVNGVLPATASAGQDPGDHISPHGQGTLPFIQDFNFASCSGQLPPPTFAQILASAGGNPAFDYKTHLQRAHTGQSSALFGGLCSGRPLGDQIARGYITVDTVNNCTLRLPSDPAYFFSDILFQNVLWGDYFHVNSGQNSAQGNPLVQIEASPGAGVDALNGTYLPPGDPATTTPGRYTFYGRYVGWNAADHREPLATTFAARYLNGGAFTGGTDLLVWRDSKTSQNAFTCPAIPGLRPPWFPLGQEGIVIFDEQEQAQVPPSVPIGPQPPNTGIIPFPAEAQRTHVGGGSFPVPFTFGWLFMDLNTTISGNPNPPFDPAASQAFVEVVHSAEGRFSVGHNAIQLDSATAPNHFQP